MLIAASEGLPLDLFFMASSCVPATHWEDAGAVLGPAEVRELLARPRVLGLAEVMDIPAVLGGRADVLEKIAGGARRPGRSSTATRPACRAASLIAYAAAGIRSDHESTTADEARAKAALGMLVQVREGSSAQNLDALLAAAGRRRDRRAWCLVTDDIFPDDLRRHGHIDGLLRRLVAGGVRAGRRRPACRARAGPALRPARSRRRGARLSRRPRRGRRPARLPGPAP